jgi:RNA polymerase sigma-70 factor (ECF subfamily)
MTRPDDPHDTTGFAALLQAARAGDEAALERLLVHTEDRLRRVVDHRLGARLRAMLRRSDVLQNSYLAMLDALPRFTGETEDDFVAWVARIIENDIRRQHRWFGAGKRRAPSRTSERNLLLGILMPPTPTPSAEVSSSEERVRLQTALQRLEPDHRRVIELTVFDELAHSEVAQRMGRSEGACRMLLMRARTALALELERLAGG